MVFLPISPSKTQSEFLDKEKRELERKNEVLKHKVDMLNEDLNEAKVPIFSII
jgi:sugar-specific transcriptional regulator TrmB